MFDEFIISTIFEKDVFGKKLYNNDKNDNTCFSMASFPKMNQIKNVLQNTKLTKKKHYTKILGPQVTKL